MPEVVSSALGATFRDLRHFYESLLIANCSVRSSSRLGPQGSRHSRITDGLR